MKIEKVKIAKLNPAKYNPRRMTNKQYKDLKNSLEKFGLVDPIIINADNTVVGGHQRLRIMRELGAEIVPVVRLNLSKEDEKELNIRLNKNTAEFDLDVLANNFEIDELKDWGFKDVELGFNIDKIVDGNIEDDHIPEVKQSRVKLGDVWQLGKHRLMCGDSTKPNNVNLLFNNNEIELIYTDPPYSSGGYQESGKTSGSIGARGQKKIASDNLSTRGYIHLMNNALSNRPTAHSVFIFCDWKMWVYNLDIAEAKGYRVRNMIVWDKMQMGMGMPFRNQHELCLFGSKIAGKIGDGKTPNVLQFKRDREAIHSTPKPVGLIVKMLKQIVSKNVYDPFMGGGSTLIACEKTNRVCYGMELDTKYCDVIIERWEQFTGQKAKKI